MAGSTKSTSTTAPDRACRARAPTRTHSALSSARAHAAARTARRRARRWVASRARRAARRLAARPHRAAPVNPRQGRDAPPVPPDGPRRPRFVAASQSMRKRARVVRSRRTRICPPFRRAVNSVCPRRLEPRRLRTLGQRGGCPGWRTPSSWPAFVPLVPSLPRPAHGQHSAQTSTCSITCPNRDGGGGGGGGGGGAKDPHATTTRPVHQPWPWCGGSDLHGRVRVHRERIHACTSARARQHPAGSPQARHRRPHVRARVPKPQFNCFRRAANSRHAGVRPRRGRKRPGRAGSVPQRSVGRPRPPPG